MAEPDDTDDADETERVVQNALDQVGRKLDILTDSATNAVEAGGKRAERGREAVPHIEDAIAVLGVIQRNGNRRAGDILEETAMADRCLARAARALRLDYEQV